VARLCLRTVDIFCTPLRRDAHCLSTVSGRLEVSQNYKTRQIKYIKTTYNTTSPNILFIPGYLAGKDGDKATALQNICDKHHFNFTRYDPTGIGETEGVKFEEARFSDWLFDAIQMLQNVVNPGKTVVVGSSLGSWISCYLAWKNPEKFDGLMLFCPAFNSGQFVWDLILSSVPEESRQRLKAGETVTITSMGDWEEFTISKDVRNDMMIHNLSLAPKSINLKCPVRMIHAVDDGVIRFDRSVNRDVVEMFEGNDVEISLVKQGGHELVNERCLEVVERMACELVQKAK